MGGRTIPWDDPCRPALSVPENPPQTPPVTALGADQLRELADLLDVLSKLSSTSALRLTTTTVELYGQPIGITMLDDDTVSSATPLVHVLPRPR